MLILGLIRINTDRCIVNIRRITIYSGQSVATNSSSICIFNDCILRVRIQSINGQSFSHFKIKETLARQISICTNDIFSVIRTGSNLNREFDFLSCKSGRKFSLFCAIDDNYFGQIQANLTVKILFFVSIGNYNILCFVFNKIKIRCRIFSIRIQSRLSAIHVNLGFNQIITRNRALFFNYCIIARTKTGNSQFLIFSQFEEVLFSGKLTLLILNILKTFLYSNFICLVRINRRTKLFLQLQRCTIHIYNIVEFEQRELCTGHGNIVFNHIWIIVKFISMGQIRVVINHVVNNSINICDSQSDIDFTI